MLLLFVAMFGVREALYIENPDVHLYEHAGTIKIQTWIQMIQHKKLN